ncbi:MAG: hypothetical protein RLO08_00280 [Parvibaculaceae bacterium]|jgi:hypothetical protein
MPAILIWAAGGAVAGFAGGFYAGGGVDAMSRAVKWGAVGAGVYLVGRHYKAW